MIDEWIRRITHVVEALAKVYKNEQEMKRWNVKYAKKLAWLINVAIQSVLISIKSTILMSCSHFQS